MARKKTRVPWLERHKNGIYYAHWYNPQKRRTDRLSLHTDEAQEAQIHFATFLREANDLVSDSAGGLSVSVVLDDYIREHVEQHVVDVDRQKHIAKQLTSFFAEQPIESVDIPACRKYTEHRRNAVSDATIIRELGVLSAAAHHAKRWKRIKELPVIEKPKDTRNAIDRQAPYYIKEDVKALLHFAPPDLHDFIMVAYYTGARRKSIENLESKQIDWKANRIVLMKADKRATKKRQAIVPIFPEIREILERRSKKLMPFDGRSYYRDFKKLANLIGLDGHPHLLRHSRATHLLQDGAKLYTVARLLGDTVQTVERVYGHHSPDQIANELESVGGL